MKLTGYHYSVTGASGYPFYEDQIERCVINRFALPTFPVAIHGFGHEWISEFDPKDTVVPGMVRRVADNKSGETVCQIIFAGVDRYEILLNDERVAVHINGGSYAFFSGEAIVARIESAREIPADVPEKLRDYDCELVCRATLSEPMKPELVLAILSFPLLRFAA